MSATSCPPSTTVIYSGGKVSATSFLIISVHAGDFELVLMTAVFPPEMLAARTPKLKSRGKLNGLMIRVTP